MGCATGKEDLKKDSAEERAVRKLSVNTRTILKELNGMPNGFCFRKVIGHGQYGRILLWESREGDKFAIKAVNKKNIPYFQLMEEVKILSKVDHPNIVKYFSSFQSEKYLYVVMEYCPGGNLFERILKQEKFNEGEAKKLMGEILRAISHCHHIGIIHRDLKPENIMYSAQGVLKIIDFGLSMHANTFSILKTAGTKYYIAPEILKSGTFTTACDMWSLGILFYILLSGYVPILGSTLQEVTEYIKNFQGPTFNGEAWKKVSMHAKDLVKRMLDTNFETRITAADALEHPWFKLEAGNETECNPELLKQLSKYGEFSDLKKKILNLMVKGTNEADLKDSQKVFFELDKNNTGLITCKDLHVYLKKGGYEVTAEELERITKKANYKGEAFINYSEFIAATIATQHFLTEEKLWSFFRRMEVKKQGILNQVALERALESKSTVMNIGAVSYTHLTLPTICSV
eukprot:TRINITY_DN1470_c0_g4_i3.p1 TRINITY_DN1470_c0_g4~~TRINITY_DN1470_c0_g4_i3.p1  ORF type:complete len:460 (+),score=131.30 TRINITY_DN1470_c0_g4_i3:102-1481(+)